jgi:hypothetical protein
VYEPETYALGGALMAAAFHRHATADSRLHAFLSVDALNAVCSRAVLSLTALQDLFSCALAGRTEEVWDVWCRLAEMHGLPVSPAGKTLHPPLLSDLRHRLSDKVARRLLADFMRANRALAKSLCDAWSTGRLLGGQRWYLATVALFHWNRIGLDQASRVRILTGMMARPMMLDMTDDRLRQVVTTHY